MANILIIGKCNALENNLNEHHLFYSQDVDIRDDDLTGLLKFALDKEIDLTIAISPKALMSDIVSFFSENGQNIFGPTRQACSTFFNRIYEKKFLYRIHAQCPKFAAFSRPQEIKEYLKEANYPIIISAPDKSSNLCTTFAPAQKILNNLYIEGETDIFIEEYIYGRSFTSYYITDGYSALPLATVGYDENDTCFVPNYYLNTNTDDIAIDIISALAHKGSPYVGIFGISGKITREDEIITTGVKTFLSENEAQAVLNTCEDDLYKIFTSCVEGLFADEYTEIKTNNLQSISKIVEGKIITHSASTLSQAKKYMEECLD